MRAQHGMKLEADHIYLMPPRHEMAVSDGQLTLTERDPGKGLFLPIDVFFRSLAEDAGARAVGHRAVGDGQRRIARRAGDPRGGRAGDCAGRQRPSSTACRAARVDTGTVDVVLPPELMGEALARYLEHDGRLERGRRAEAPMCSRGIFELLRRESGIDFAGYKASTVGRRIQRRLLLTRSEDMGEYLDRIADGSGRARARCTATC